MQGAYLTLSIELLLASCGSEIENEMICQLAKSEANASFYELIEI